MYVRTGHVHASCNAVKLAWGSLRLAPIIEADYHNNKNIEWAHEGHAGGGRETIIQFVVALNSYTTEKLRSLE